MTAGRITLEIVTPQGLALRDEVDQVEAPSVHGEFGVLPGHLPLLAALRTGIVTLHKGSDETRVAVAQGFIEVGDDRALLLTDKIAQKGDLDPVALRLELKEVDHELDRYAGPVGTAEWKALVSRELWAAVRLELYGDPPPATQRPQEQFGPPTRTPEDEEGIPVAEESPAPHAEH